jgi:hypothetical protein
VFYSYLCRTKIYIYIYIYIITFKRTDVSCQFLFIYTLVQLIFLLFVDSEWRHGRGGHLTLQDEDLTTKTIYGWKKLNTLAHYGVKESAVMSLIPRQNDSFNANCKQPCQNCEFVHE